MKLHIVQFAPLYSYLVPLRPKYLPQRPIPEHLQSVSFRQCIRPSFTTS